VTPGEKKYKRTRAYFYENLCSRWKYENSNIFSRGDLLRAIFDKQEKYLNDLNKPSDGI